MITKIEVCSEQRSKQEWKDQLKQKMKSLIRQHEKGTLPLSQIRNPTYFDLEKGESLSSIVSQATSLDCEEKALLEEIDRVMKLKHTHRDRQYAVATVELVGDDREYDVHMQYLPTELFDGFVERKWTSRELYERTVAAHRRLVIRELV